MLSNNKNYNKIKIGEKNFLGIIFWYMYFYKKLYNFNFFNLFLIKQTYINFFNLFILHYRIILLNKVIKKYYNYFYNCFKLSLNKNKYFYFYFKCFLLQYNYDMYTKFKSYIFFRLKRLNRKIKTLVKRKKIKKVKNFGILHITFKKRNIFFNLSSFKSKTLFLTTVRKEGFIGRRRREYISIYSTIRIIKKKFKRYKLKKLAVLYSGWSRFKIAVKNSLRYRDWYKIPRIFVKYLVKIPHNGNRIKKKKRKKKKKKIWLKRKNLYLKSKVKKWKPVISTENYIKKHYFNSNPFYDIKKKHHKKNKNV